MLSGSPPATNRNVRELLEKFSSGSPRQQRSLIKSVESSSSDLAALGKDLLTAFDPDGDQWAAGWILQVLQRHNPEAIPELVSDTKRGWFSWHSATDIDYGQLQEDLLYERFENADRFTSHVLRQLAGKEAVSRGYVYFSEVNDMSELDLLTLDRLWLAYSQGRFGFSVQRRLLAAVGGRYDLLWPRIGWKVDGIWTRYPTAFNWSIQAPEGHMPLTNQLRGVRLIDALLNHPAIVSRSETNKKK